MVPYSVLFDTTLQSHLTKGFLHRPAGGRAPIRRSTTSVWRPEPLVTEQEILRKSKYIINKQEESWHRKLKYDNVSDLLIKCTVMKNVHAFLYDDRHFTITLLQVRLQTTTKDWTRCMVLCHTDTLRYVQAYVHTIYSRRMC